jgi:hypothetical protein
VRPSPPLPPRPLHADNWGALLPAMEALLAARWPFLSAAEAAAARLAPGGAGPAAAIVVSRRGTDVDLAALAAQVGAALGPWGMSWCLSLPACILSRGPSLYVLLPPHRLQAAEPAPPPAAVEGEVPAAAAAGAAADATTAAPPPPPPRVVLELGWTLHPPKQLGGGEGEEGGGEEAEPEEEPELEFTVAAYNAKVGFGELEIWRGLPAHSRRR